MDDNAAALGVLVGGLFLVGIALFVWLIHTARAKGRSWTWALLPGALSKCLEVLGQLVGGHDSQGLQIILSLVGTVVGISIVVNLSEKKNTQGAHKE